MKKIIVLISLIVCSHMLAQNNVNLFPNVVERAQKCQYFTQVFKQKPKEVKFSIKAEGTKLFFEITDKKWFDKLFIKSGDALAIDVVSKAKYACTVKKIERQQIRGIFLQPVFAKRLKRGLKKASNGRYRVYVGNIPKEVVGEDLEFNILFFNNKTLCTYYWLYDLERYPWDLLDMGMYLDTIAYATKTITSIKEKTHTKYKTLVFTIPFKKNKAIYASEDIKPLYDSLQLTDFNIKKINIRAYSSVEGSLQRNIELQEQRAASIVKALQSFQKPTMITEISSSENWVEFLKDISGTAYDNLKTLDKKQLKARLVGELSNKLEPYLKLHRKAVIKLSLERKETYEETSVSELTTLFNKTLAENKVTKALQIQNAIFQKLKGKEKIPEALEKMKIPMQLKFVPLLNKNSMYLYRMHDEYLFVTYEKLEELAKLDPLNGKVKYNLIVLYFKLWKLGYPSFNATQIKRKIAALKNYKIPQPLIDRMMVNYHIVKAEKLMRARKYAEKDISIEFIEDNYEKFQKTDYDYLSLAQFFCFYANNDLAIDLLEEKMQEITVDEDLLFYYINLTIIDEGLTSSPDYRTMMLNAINMNKKRFCKLFNSISKGGVTFQLLENKYLRKTYCENCVE